MFGLGFWNCFALCETSFTDPMMMLMISCLPYKCHKLIKVAANSVGRQTTWWCGRETSPWIIKFTRTYSEHFNLASNVSKQVDPRRTVTFLVIVLGARSLKTQRNQTNKHSHEMHSQWAIFTCANMQTWIKSRYIQLLVDWIFAFFFVQQ